jgi:uncharacterized membrane protein YjjP (DUF1212 family)
MSNETFSNAMFVVSISSFVIAMIAFIYNYTDIVIIGLVLCFVSGIFMDGDPTND